MLPFVTQYLPTVPNLKEILVNKIMMVKQPLLRAIGTQPLRSKKRCSLKDVLMTAKLLFHSKYEINSMKLNW